MGPCGTYDSHGGRIRGDLRRSSYTSQLATLARACAAVREGS